jgi:hypothetical protein
MDWLEDATSLAPRNIGDPVIRLEGGFLDNPDLALLAWQAEQLWAHRVLIRPALAG